MCLALEASSRRDGTCIGAGSLLSVVNDVKFALPFSFPSFVGEGYFGLVNWCHELDQLVVHVKWVTPSEDVWGTLDANPLLFHQYL